MQLLNLKLKTVTFAADSQLETIEEKAFKNCPEITQIVLPDSVKITERKVFEGCEKMATISIGTNLQELGSQIFSKWVNVEYIEKQEVVTMVQISMTIEVPIKTNSVLVRSF